MLRNIDIVADDNGMVQPKNITVLDWIIPVDPDTKEPSKERKIHRARVIPDAALQEIADVINKHLGGSTKAAERIEKAHQQYLDKKAAEQKAAAEKAK